MTMFVGEAVSPLPIAMAEVAASCWSDRLDAYLLRLQQAADRLQQTLGDLGQTVIDETPESSSTAQQAAESVLLELEELISWRTELIRATDTPATGISLRQIIQHSTLPQRETLLARCDSVAQGVGRSRERAIASFACQFHLADFTSKLLSILTGSDEATATYSNGGQQPLRRGHQGGNLMNQSA